MARTGRPPKPTRLKVVTGNPGKRKLNDDEPAYDPLDLSVPPENLSGTAKEIWEEYGPELQASKVLTVVDAHNFRAFCINYDLWDRAATKLLEGSTADFTEETMQGGSKKNPLISAYNDFQRNWERLGGLLGLDPSSRTRLQVPGTRGKDNPYGKRRRSS